ncbi:hypothetical protein ACEWY4_021239 [Coilia grayii]|uniref:Uncharacterized protein n=1 Tax=Coilia grayii TaxID=363190 RepID=A0ABD1JBN0_9TELE
MCEHLCECVTLCEYVCVCVCVCLMVVYGQMFRGAMTLCDILCVLSTLHQASSSKAPGASAAVAAPTTSASSGAEAAPAPASSSQGELDLFSEGSSSGTGSKAEDSAKKPLSKDSILSLYGSSSVPQQPTQAGMFMGASQMQFPAQPAANFQAFPGMGGVMPPTTTMMGAVMGQGAAPVPAMMGQNPAAAAGMMVGMTMPNGFMGSAQAAGVMGLAPGMMGAAQPGAMPAGVVPPQNMYAMQPGQQPQWNMAQVSAERVAAVAQWSESRSWDRRVGQYVPMLFQ